MLVNLSYTIANPYYSYKVVHFADEELNRVFQYNTRFIQVGKYLNHIQQLEDYQKYTHFRIDPKIPNFAYKDFVKYINSSNITSEQMDIHVSSFSMHTNFSYTFYRFEDLEKILNYYQMCMLYKNLAAFNQFFICSHIRYKNYCDCIQILNYLLYKEPELTNSLCFENCGHFADLAECLKICEQIGQPLIYDNFHNRLNGNYNVRRYIPRIIKTWENFPSIPIIHYSNGDEQGRHGTAINKEELFTILNMFKHSLNQIIVIIELKRPKDAIKKFRTETLDTINWNNYMSFYI